MVADPVHVALAAMAADNHTGLLVYHDPPGPRPCKDIQSPEQTYRHPRSTAYYVVELATVKKLQGALATGAPTPLH